MSGLRTMFSKLSQAEQPDPYWSRVGLLWRADGNLKDEKRTTIDWSTNSGNFPPYYDTGKFGLTGIFDSNRLIKNTSSTWNNTENFTIEFWYNLDASAFGYIGCLTTASSNTGLFFVKIFRDQLYPNQLQFMLVGVDNLPLSSDYINFTFTVGTWKFFQLHFQYYAQVTPGRPGYMLKVYVDGVEQTWVVNGTFPLIDTSNTDTVAYITDSSLRFYLGYSGETWTGSGISFSTQAMKIDDFRLTHNLLRTPGIPTKRFPNF